MFLYHMRVSARLTLAGFVVLLGLILVAALAGEQTRRDAMAAHRDRIRNLVEVATGIIGDYQAAVDEGSLDKVNAQRLAQQALRNLRYGKNDYFFVYDFDGRALMVAGNPSIEGKIMLGNVDAHGFKLWDRFVEVAKTTGAGYVEYWFPRAGKGTPLPKLSYVVSVKGWNWIIGTGVYIDDIDEAVDKAIIEYSVASLLILAVATLVAWQVSRSIVLQLGGEPHDAAAKMKCIANGDLTVNIPVKKNDQDSLMASLKLMQIKLANLARAVHENTTSLGKQTNAFETAAGVFAENSSAENHQHVQQSVDKLHKTVEILKRSVARFNI